MRVAGCVAGRGSKIVLYTPRDNGSRSVLSQHLIICWDELPVATLLNWFHCDEWMQGLTVYALLKIECSSIDLLLVDVCHDILSFF